jgi:hypothetical protein
VAWCIRVIALALAIVDDALMIQPRSARRVNRIPTNQAKAWMSAIDGGPLRNAVAGSNSAGGRGPGPLDEACTYVPVVAFAMEHRRHEAMRRALVARRGRDQGVRLDF